MASITTIDALNLAMEKDFKSVQHYLSQVTVEEDLCSFLRWLSDNEVESTIVTKLQRYKRRGKGIHPSSASKAIKKLCLLKLYYECTFEIPPEDAYDQKMQLTWDVGTLLHDTYQLWFEEMYGKQFEKEVKLVSDDGYIKSRTDGIFSFTNYRFILEMKSIKEGGNFGWETVQSTPMEDHVRQAHFYMWLSNVPFALIFYINKNAGEFKEHAIMFNQNLWDEIMAEVIEPVVNAAYHKGDSVAANPSWACRWCLFQNKCPEKGGRDEDVTW